MNDPKKSIKNYTVEEKLEILGAAKSIGLAETALKYKASKASIYNWQKQFETLGAIGLQDGRSSNIGGKPVPDWKRTKILAVKETDPGFGASQIRNQRCGLYRGATPCREKRLPSL
jgi:transposase-like protein